MLYQKKKRKETRHVH